MSFIAFLRDIPAPAWGLAGAIVGVLGTLGATLITNSSNTQRFEARLKFDEKEKAKDREVDLRRSVYMTAAESVVGMRALLGRLGSIDPRNQRELTSEVSEFQKAMAKVSLVASEVTREKVAQLASAYGRVFVELMGSAGACHRLKIDMEINRKSYDDANAERLRITAAIRESNESAEAKIQS